MNIGLCIISRERPTQLSATISSFLKLAHNPSNIKAYVGVDINDPCYDAYRTICASIPSCTLITLPYNPGKPRFGMMWNEVAKWCPCDIFAMIADDLICESANWDRITLEVSGLNKDGIFMLYGRDGIQDMRLATHPIIGRKYYDILGELFPPEIIIDFTDVWIMDIFTTIKRAYYSHNLSFNHNHPIKTGICDNVYLHNRQFIGEAREVWESVKGRIPAAITKITNYMESYGSTN
jgi:hypothetical protein